ncbi:CPBP family intramembrane metalloprotease [Rhodococcus rhodnii]|uniref:CPBP family intramembrane metalloprotease n=1 Tax=Rhodococcus rhodnii TaxID=38312 RepID=A0A6P2CMN0_9NOCA|nr:CPBP family intramembrane glutamic endopeptidase [Rhodococcus rhodnii]TXG92278.1 CPBP family intramembrane metalloprotease [Rhodococcus rhodnii]
MTPTAVRHPLDLRAALALAAGAVGWNNLVVPSLGPGPRGRTAINAATAGAVVAAWRLRGHGATDLGLAREQVRSGLTRGAAVAAVPIAAYATMLSVPPLRRRLARTDRNDVAEWLLVHIPLGTVLVEELVFRGALHASSRALPPAAGIALHAAAFGLWHARGAHRAGESVVGTVAFTGASAVVFDVLRRRTGSVLAPALLHLAVNVGGAGAALWAGRAAA